jgi:predicted transcriptional regulator
VDQPAFFSALGNPMRWELVKIMATGKALSASEAAKAVGRDFDGVSKHLRILRRARVVASRRAEDGRLKLYYIPESIRRMDGVLDYGFCVIKVG